MRLLLCIALFIASQLSLAKWHGDDQDIMGTKVSVALWLEDDRKAEQAVAAVMAEMHRIDKHFSPYIETSELYRANQLAPKSSAQKPLSISPELAAIIEKSLHYSQLSDGAFDITFASLARYYDYRNKLSPSERQREELLPAINYRLIHLDTKNNTLWFEHPKLYIDLGGIAKGYAVDNAIEILQSFGVKHASVGAGGDSRVIGDKFGRPWLVGIKNPRADAVAITLPLEDVAVSTSGDYERYFIDDKGERVHHIINPRTGKSTNGINSVTIIGPLGFDTDPLSTSVFVMGAEKGMALINRLPGFDAVIISSEGKVSYSKGLMPPE
ncbi:MAG: FAD:protein FMN transferase [Cellvibrio sp.]|uniref:FAD:protein FMN transferase n=1 Tax=Cellvibrio sp. TaxID=1965322 RepID=UPI002721BE9F|nr:FAD:protein FMN transferase [Cellvibrio sp.]